jgi:hypothetical protein
MSDSYFIKRVEKLEKLVEQLEKENHELKIRLESNRIKEIYRTTYRSLDSRLDCRIRSGDSLNTLLSAD